MVVSSLDFDLALPIPASKIGPVIFSPGEPQPLTSRAYNERVCRLVSD
jgi:hypothetical protein